MTWKERWIGIPLAFLGGCMAIAAAAAFVLTRTTWGHARAADLLRDRLLPLLEGQIAFATLSGDDLLRGARLSDVRVSDPNGVPVVYADTIEVEYDWHDFLRRDVLIRSARLVRPVILLEEGRDGEWNFERAFGTRGTEPARPAAAAERPSRVGLRIEFRRVTIVDGSFTLRMPTSEEEGFWRTEREEDGFWQVLQILDFDGRLPYLRLLSRSDEPVRIDVGELAGVAHLTARPATLRDLQAVIQLTGDSILFDLPKVVLPDSRLSGRGAMWTAEAGTEVNLTLQGKPVAFADVTWVVPWLPAEGGGAFDLRLRTVPGGLDFDFEDAEVRIGASHLSGRFGFLLPDDGEIRFKRMDLELDPLETRWIDQISGDTLFYSGNLRGPVRGDGPLSHMTLETDLILEPATGHAPSHLTAAGILTWDGSFGGSPLHMTFDGLEMEIVNALLNPDLPVRGRLSGTSTFTGTLLKGLGVEADLVHSDIGAQSSHFRGGGVVLGVERPHIDLKIETDPVSLTTLARYYPALPFRGEVRGPVVLRGTLDDLDVDARVATPRGRLVLRGRFDLQGEPKRYAADLEGEEVQVAALRPGVPASDLDFEGRIEGEGMEPEELRLQGWIRLRQSQFAGARVDSAFVRLAAQEGLLTVDSAWVQSEAGTLRVHGNFGLREDAGGTLSFQAKVDTLAAWNRWLAPVEDTVQPLATLADLGGSLAFGSEPIAQGPQGPLRGVAVASGTVTGNIERIALEGRARLTEIGWEDAVGEEITVALTAEGPPGAPRIEGRIDAREVHAFGFEVSTGHLDVAWAGDTVQVGALLTKDPEATVRARADLVRLPVGVRVTVGSLDLSVRGRTLALDSPVTLVREGRAFRVEPFRLAGALGTLAGEVAIGERAAAVVRLNVSGLDIADVAALWPEAPEMKGGVVVDLRLTGEPRDPVAEFDVQVSNGELVGADFSRLAARGRFEDGDLRFEVNAFRERDVLFEASGRIPLVLDLLALRWGRSERPMEIAVRAEEFPLAFALPRFEQFRDVRGHLQGRVALHGSFDEPQLDGQIQIVGGATRLPRVGVHVFDVEGRVRFRGDIAQLEGVTARAPDGGRGRVEGSIRLRPLSNPEFNLRFDVDRFLGYNSRIARTVVTGSVNLTGFYRRPVVTGTLTVESGALFVREVERQREIIDLADPAFFSVVDTTLAENRRLLPLISDPFFQNMTVDLTLRLSRDSWLRARDRAIEIAGDLQLRWDRAQQDLRISGALEALRGDYTYLGKRFTVEGGTIEFVGTPGVNPDLNLVARHVVRTPERPLTIRIIVTGTLESPKIRLESDAQPPIDEAGLLSYLVFGRPFSELARGTTDGGPGVVSTVREGVLGYAASELEAFLVSETGLVDYLQITGGTAVDPTYRSETNGVGVATRVEAGWYLAPDIFVSVGQRFGGSRRSEIPDVRLDWRVTRNLSLQFVSEERSRRYESAVETAAPQRAFGLFLFHEWSY